MKSLVILLLLFVPYLSFAKRAAPSSSYTMTANFFTCAESRSGLCAKDVKDGGGVMPYTTFRPEATYHVEHSPEFEVKILQIMKAAGITSIHGKIQGFTIVGTYTRPDQLILTGILELAR